MNIRTCLTILWLTIGSFTASAQNDSVFLRKAINALTAHEQAMPAEKVYLHLDKPYYYPGDTIWFKAYTVVGYHHQLSALSGVLYTELINDKDSVIIRHTLPLTSGLTWGDFDLPHSISSGLYRIRAYTNWMRNAGADYFFNQRIRIGAPGLHALNQPAPARPDVQFFPEGGEMVAGLRSRIAVKSINAAGLGEYIKGIITDNDGNEVAQFATQHLGMGVFALIPVAGKTYKAKISCADSTQFTQDLPPAQPEGFTLTINNSFTDSIYVKITASDKLFHELQNSMFYLVAQSAGKVYYTTAAQLSSPVFVVNIAKARFPSGILQFTLFSHDGGPLNERIVFVQNDDTVKMALLTDLQKSTPRQKMSLKLDTKGEGKSVVVGSYSVSVTNESRIPVDGQSENTIMNNLLLTSDLKGYIEKPNYYFYQGDVQARADLDLLMLTQGYRRFEWKKVLNNSYTPVAYNPEKDLELAGTLKTPSGKPVPNGKVTLLATRQNFLEDTLTDINGNFRFPGLTLPDTARIVIRSRKQNNGSNVAIYVKQPDYPGILRNTVSTDTITKLTAEMLKNISAYKELQKRDSLKNGRVLSEVTIKARKKSAPDEFNQWGTVLEYQVDMTRLNKEFNSLRDGLPLLIPGAAYLNGSIKYQFSPAQLIIDGLRHDASDLDMYSVNELDNIRMIDATGRSPAILFITTKRYAGTDTASTILKEVKITAKRDNKPDMSESANLHGGGNADQVLMGDVVSGCITLSDCLRGKVFGVNFNTDGTPVNTRGNKNMSVIIDGVIMDGSSLNDINADDIYSIEVLRSGAARSIYGSSIAGGGALIITMNHGNTKYATSVQPAGLISYDFKGYYKARTFYSPKYTPKSDLTQPDLRTTIYWNPNMITDKNGKLSFEYYNNDTKGGYRIVIEGINDNGDLGRQVYHYKVE